MILKNGLFELVRRRRSVRHYGSASIDDATINEIMKVALMAPTSFGHRPIEFIVVRNKETIKDIAACKTMGGSQVIGADVVIVVMADVSNKKMSEFWIEDAAIASSYILLAAEQYGLGACWVHIRNRKGKHTSSDQEIRHLLNVPEGYSVLNLVALGEKNEFEPAYDEDDINYSHVHYDSF